MKIVDRTQEDVNGTVRNLGVEVFPWLENDQKEYPSMAHFTVNFDPSDNPWDQPPRITYTGSMNPMSVETATEFAVALDTAIQIARNGGL